ncbi:MAG: disulfide bond formation protein B, partial [Alphaproteobacteria bacterium]|nr:disulfide bond formation protein B [Alphaproteobacteria bacterium]
DLRRALSRPVEVPCDQVQWSLLGMSLTGYNMLLSLLLSAACAVAAAREKMWRSP